LRQIKLFEIPWVFNFGIERVFRSRSLLRL